MRYLWNWNKPASISSSVEFKLRKLLGNVYNVSLQVKTMVEFCFTSLPTLQVFLLVLFVCTLLELFKLIWKWFSKTHRELEKMNGPWAFPIIGTVPDMIFTDFWSWSNSMCRKWGDPLRLWKFGQPMVFISTYEYAIQLLSKSDFNGKLKDLGMLYSHPGGGGLSSTPADVHPHKRKLLNPAFSRQIVEGSMETFNEETIKLVKELKKYATSGQHFDMVGSAKRCLFQMVVRSDFGDLFMQSIGEADAISHVKALETIASNMSMRMIQPYPWLKSDLIFYHFTTAGKETRKAFNVLNGFAYKAIQGRRHFRSKVSQVTPNEPSEGETLCYLDTLLDLVEHGQLTDGDVVSELNNFMGGAYDTTALTVCWTLILLALHPECQQKVQQELQEVLGSSPHPIITPSQVKCMKYLELCLKESLRLYPPAPVFPRSTVTDMKLDDGRIIPAGVDVLIFANLIQRDPRHFPEPERFLPERHLSPNPAYMPFSVGARNCIGQTYGMHQSKIVLAHLCREFVWEATVEKADQVKIKYQGLLYPENGMYFTITKR